MPAYELAEAAEADLKDIAFYTISKWSAKQAVRYGALLETHFDSIAGGQAKTKPFLRHRADLRVSKVEHHYVFHLERDARCPLILAVFHESMDLMTRLRDRL
jgi:toxin ParE1/3/4